MTPVIPRVQSIALSDVGSVRGNNEDRVWADDARGCYAVIDGMGGHAAGEKAAEIALETIKTRLERQTGTLDQRIREAITLANNSIFEASQSRAEWQGMACVLTLAVIENGAVTIGHVGDSRLYKLRDGGIQKITHDHSPVGEREDAGQLSEAEAMQHPRRNEVYRDVGSEERTPHDDDFIEIVTVPFEPDSALLLCSDGLSDVVPSGRILNAFEQHGEDRRAALQSLVAIAARDGKDNVSAVLVTGERFNRHPPRTGEITERLTPRRRNLWPSALFLLLGLLLGAVLVYFLHLAPVPPAVPGPRTIVVQGGTPIAAALANLKPGDVVQVSAGTYSGDIVLKDGVDLIARPAHDVIVEGAVSAEGITRARLEGFQIHGAVSISNSDIQIERCEISGVRAAGLQFTGNSRGSVIASFIHDNLSAGIVVRDTASPAVENNLIIGNGNQAGSLRPGLLISGSARPKVTSNIFLSNGAEAIWAPPGDEGVAARNYFTVTATPDKRKSLRIIPPQAPPQETHR